MRYERAMAEMRRNKMVQYRRRYRRGDWLLHDRRIARSICRRSFPVVALTGHLLRSFRVEFTRGLSE